MNRYIYNDGFNIEEQLFIVHREQMNYRSADGIGALDSRFIEDFEKTYMYNGKCKFGEHRLAKVEWVETVVIGDTVHGEMQFFAYKPQVMA